MATEANFIRNHTLFEEVRTRTVARLNGLDPKAAFQRVNSGFLGQYVEAIGPWRGRESMEWQVPGAAEDAVAVDPLDHTSLGTSDMFVICAQPGLLLSGKSQMIAADDFRYGMTPAQAAERSARPRIDWNQKTSKVLFDVATSGGFDDQVLGGTGTPTENFQWSVNVDMSPDKLESDICTQSADRAATVIANASQSVLWPLADGTVASANHDHVITGAGASWTETLADTARDNILEHPGMGQVHGYVGTNVAADVTAALKTGYGAIESRVPLVAGPQSGEAGGFAEANHVSPSIGGVSYSHVTNMPDDGGLYLATNRKPLFMSEGAVSTDGQPLDAGDWSDPFDAETLSRRFGYRRYLQAGVHEPISLTYVEYVA